MKNLPELPLALRHAMESGECVLFIGAGIGGHLKGSDDRTAPDAAGLAHDIAAHFSIESSSDDLAKIARIAELRKSRADLIDFIRRRLADLTPDQDILWLCSQRWKAIFTTNYDSGIERAYELLPNPFQKPISIAATSELVTYDLRLEVPIYHIHGALFGHPSKLEQRTDIVITDDDYTKFRHRRRMLFEILKLEFALSTFLYIGYRNQDDNWRRLLSEITDDFFPSSLPSSFRVSPETDSLDQEILRNRGIQTIQATFEEFVTAASSQISKLSVDPDKLKRLQATVPSELLEAFDKNPAPVLRLLHSWEYVNQAPFNQEPNTRAFLRGDRANWAVVAAEHDFSRDLEDDIYDDILDFATGSPRKPKVVMLLGPAGYGVSTLLMSIAARLVRERVGSVYYQRPTAPLLEGDVEFATGLSNDMTCFVIDNAADCARGLQDTIAHLRDLNKPAYFLCGERLNEWRQRNVRLAAQEFLLEPLSDAEIERLLDCLAGHHELNKLQPLSRELQVAVIKKSHGKELLVTMREATEDKRFDAILEDEFQGIEDDKCRELYLATCCFSQHGSYVRNALLCDIAEVPFASLHLVTRGRLDGILIDECIDTASSLFAIRARHRTIAKIVWERCGTPAEKDRILQESLVHLNLNYAADVSAFEKFVRDEWLIDSIRGFDGKTKFFETACKKDPTSPYVRQHYARMLTRAGKLELALGQIDQALGLNQKNPPRVILHTRGMVLGEMAISMENRDIARRRLAQAEEAFRRGIAMNPRDDYGYQALGSLYLNWAKTCHDDAEATTYLAKAEEILSEGFRRVRVKDSLWVCSSEIEKWLGNHPSRIRALENAVRESPGTIIARYLLGRAHRRDGRFEECLKTLDPVIKGHPDEFRPFVEYAMALYELGRSLSECIATLRISNLYGLSDPRYIATLGGLLFLNHEIADADKVFKESQLRELPPAELYAIHFRPHDPGTKAPMRLMGRIVVRKASYSLIEVEGYPPFICHASKYGGLVLRQGMRVSFEVAFSARGAIAVSPAAE